MNKTPNYQLNQWEATDKVQRADFNADNAKIDAAIKAVDGRVDGLMESKADISALTVKAEVVFGTYIGDGAASRVIELGFTPKAVYVCSDMGMTFNAVVSYSYGGLALPGYPVYGSTSRNIAVQLKENGFEVRYVERYGPKTNESGQLFHYMAFK